MSGGAVVAVKQNRLIRAFREAGALAPEQAVAPESLDCPMDWIFRMLLARGVLVEADAGRFYLSEEGVVRLRRMRTVRTGLLLLMLILLSLAALSMNR